MPSFAWSKATLRATPLAPVNVRLPPKLLVSPASDPCSMVQFCVPVPVSRTVFEPLFRKVPKPTNWSVAPAVAVVTILETSKAGVDGSVS